nr:tape measure protein [uncultured Acinetobacter sp.]
MTQESRLVIVIDSKNAERNAQNLNKELDSIERKGDYASKSMDGLSVATRQLAGYMAGLVTVGTAVSKMDAYTNMSNRLKLVTKNQAELNQALDDTFKIAQNSRAAWDGVIQVYQRFSDNAKTLGIDLKKTAELTDTVSKAVAISGASAQAADAALTQFGQALASGQLRGEELNSVLEQTPALAKAIAQGMGITVGQLRSVAAEGKITGEVLVDALTKARASVDELFSKTDMTIGQSITYLNNELTKFVGEAGKGSGAATALAGSVKVLADNLELITDAAILAGVAYLTKAIIDKTVAVQAGIASSVASRQAAIAQAEAEVQLLGVEALRARQLAALAATELGLARAEYNGATSSNARAVAIQRLTAAEVSHAIALKGSTIATDNYTLAQGRLTAASSTFGRVASGALALIGGPIGAITLGITGLAAGYMYLQHRTEEANKKLEEQMQIAKKTKEELLALKGVQKDVAINELKDAFEKQNVSLRKLNNEFLGFVDNVSRSGKQSKQVTDIFELARKGAITNAEALERLNKLNILTPEQKKQGVELVNGYIAQAQKTSDAEKALKVFGIEVKLAGNAAQNAAAQHLQQKEALDGTASAAARASQALQDYRNKQKESAFESLYKQGYLEKGYTVAQANAIYELQKIKGESAILSKEEIDSTLRTVKLTEQLKDKEDAITDAKRQQTKESDKQQKLAEKQAVLLAGNNEQVRNMLRVYQAFRNVGVEDVKARVLTAQVGREGDFANKNLFGSHKDAANGYTNSGMISWQKDRSASLMQFLKGQGLVDAKGQIQQTQDALDGMAKFLIQEIMTNKQYGKSKNALLGDNTNYRDLEQIFGKNVVAWDYNGKNIGKSKAAKNLARQDTYFDQLSKILGSKPDDVTGAIKNLSKFEDEAYKARAKTLDEIKQLQAQFDTETLARSKARDEQIEKATVLGQEQLIPEIKLRYEAQEKIAKLQLDNELNGYKWTEEQKLEFTKQINILRLDAEGKLSEDQKAIAKKAYDDIYQYDIDAFRRTKALKFAEFQQSMLNEINFSRDLIAKNTMMPHRYQQFSLMQSYLEAIRQTNMDELSKKDAVSKDKDLTDTEKYDQLLQIEAAYQEKRFALISDFSKREQDLRTEQAQSTLNTYESIMGGLAGMLDKNSKEYAVAISVQRGIAVASATMAAWQAYTQAFADPTAMTLPQKFAGAASVLAAVMPAIQAISSARMPAYRKGGLVTGAGTGTSDSITAKLSNGEHVATAWAVNKIGAENYDYMNRTGQLPPNRDDAQLNAIQRQQRQTNLINESVSQRNASSNQVQQEPPQVYVNPNIAIIDDRKTYREYMRSQAGQQDILYVIDQNRTKWGLKR